MPSITLDVQSPNKILLIGKSGAGKTGSLASLVAAGYNLRIIDTDKGVRTIRSLITDDEHYPYARLISAKGIDINKAVRYVPIDTSMKLRNIQRKVNDRIFSENLLAPTDAKAWLRVLEYLDKWQDDDLTLGHVGTWGLDDILVIDSFSTLAKCAYYFSQSLNNRLGARDQGFDYQRDVGEAQAQLTRLLELLYDSNIGCHIIVISHITWVDESKGVAARPKTGNSDEPMSFVMSNPDGYPSAIGRALSPHMGKYFNDVYVVRSEGSGQSVRRTISTVPQDGVGAKHSVYLEPEYPVTYGLAEIFARLRNQPSPTELIEAFARRPAAPVAPAGSFANVPITKLGPKSAAGT